MKTLRILSCIFGVIFIAFGTLGLVVSIGSSDALYLSTFSYEDDSTPSWFKNKRVLQLSDWHNHDFNYCNGDIVSHINKVDFDYCFMTGDFLDNHTVFGDWWSLDEKETNIHTFIKILTALKDIPTFYINGNHEEYGVDNGNKYDLETDIVPLLEEYGVVYLDNEVYRLLNPSNHLEYINIIGIRDPFMFVNDKNSIGTYNEEMSLQYEEMFEKVLTDNDVKSSDFNILLAHRPEYMELYSRIQYGINVVFSGHTHGGQIKLFGSVLYIVNQKPFPKYVQGVYRENSTTMYLSPGIGYSYKLQIRYKIPARMYLVIF